MDILLGVGTLVLVLVIMTLFLKYAPYGKQGLQALSGAACATFTTSILKLCYWWRI